MSSKFYVHCGRKWRSVEPETGEVQGWGKARFVYVRDGALHAADTSSVLKGLRSLLQGQPTTVRDGPHLPAFPSEHFRRESIEVREKDDCCLVHHCCTIAHNDRHFINVPQKVSTADAAVQVTYTNSTTTQTIIEDEVPQKPLNKLWQKEMRGLRESVIKCRRSSTSSLSSQRSDAGFLELIITESDLTAIRQSIQSRIVLPGVNLRRFDKENGYKYSVLMKLNPYVVLRRCTRIAQMLERGEKISLHRRSIDDFASVLGLQAVKKNTGESDSEDKENSSRKSNRVLRSSLRKSNNNTKFDELKTVFNGQVSKSSVQNVVKPVPSRGKMREYSALEDTAIVRWVAGSGREHHVNGNVLWRDLQTEYPGLTGQRRSWHSLRNRYLRYLLPTLGALQLPSDVVSRLRAAASRGEIKKHSRRNSIFDAAPVRSAWALRPKSHSDDSGPKSSSENEFQAKPRRSRRSGASQTSPPPRTRKLFNHRAGFAL